MREKERWRDKEEDREREREQNEKIKRHVEGWPVYEEGSGSERMRERRWRKLGR